MDEWAQGFDEFPDSVVRDDSSVLETDWIEYGKQLKSIYTNTTFGEQRSALFRVEKFLFIVKHINKILLIVLVS